MKKFIMLLIFIILFPVICCAKTLNILIIGQSNAAGRATIHDEDKHFIKGAYILHGYKFRTAKSPLNQYSTIKKDVNQGLSFAHTLLEKLSVHNNVNAIINARGGSNIASWSRGGSNYDDTVDRVNTMGLMVDVIFYHQGEADRKDNAFYTKLTATVRRLRKDINSDCPFIIGEIAESASHSIDHNKSLHLIPDLIHSVAVVSSKGLTTVGDYHFDNKSQKILGTRYYDTYVSLTNQK